MFGDELRTISALPDDELMSWFTDFQQKAKGGNADFNHAHDEFKLSVDELRTLLVKATDNIDVITHGAGSPWHNLWHWLRG